MQGFYLRRYSDDRYLSINGGDYFGGPNCVGRGKFQINGADLNQIKIDSCHNIAGVDG